MITVKSVYLSMCLKLCMLIASLHNSSSQLLHLIADGGTVFELHPTNLNLPFCS